MQHEFWSTYTFLPSSDATQRQTMDYLLGVDGPSRQLQHLSAVQDPAARIDLLTQAVQTSQKEYARAGSRREPGGLWHLYNSGQFNTYLRSRIAAFVEPLGLLPELPDLRPLPRYSFALHFTFTLSQPYLSKDDTEFYIVDNPVKKEWVFKVPYVAPSQWKGTLRSGLTLHLVDNPPSSDQQWIEKRLQLARLFGNEKEVGLEDKSCEAYLDTQRPALAQAYRQRLHDAYTSTGFLSGRLYFYPTYFDRISLELINPHDRNSGAGQQPIYFEAVPPETSGTFTLLYVPFDRIGETADTIRQQVVSDLECVAEGINDMMTIYGFGAKTSSGFGLAEEDIEGELIFKDSDTSDPASPVSHDVFGSIEDMTKKARGVTVLAGRGQTHG